MSVVSAPARPVSFQLTTPPPTDGSTRARTGFLSTPHGVLNDSGRDRYSIAFFYSPNPAVTIECLPSCVSASNPARYPAALYRDLILAFFNANYFHRKGYAAEAAS